MSNKLITQEFDKSKIAYDLALALVVRDSNSKDGAALLKDFNDRYQECLVAVVAFQKENKKKPFRIKDTL